MNKISKKVTRTMNISEELLTITPAVPKSVKIEVSAYCDLKCFYCAVSHKERQKGHIEPDFLFKILDEIKAAGVKEVGLFWMGESFLNKKLPEYIAYAKKIGISYVFLTTNGRLANEETLAPVFDSGLDSLKFSINAHNRESYLKICGVDCFDQVIANIKSAFMIRGERKKPAIYSSSVYDPEREKEYKKIHSMVSPYVDEHYPLRLYGHFSLDTNSKKITAHDHNRSLVSMLPCWSLFTEPHISYDGYMSACYCDFEPTFFMADLKKVSFMDAWHSPEFIKLRRQHLKNDVKGTPCENCGAYK